MRGVRVARDPIHPTLQRSSDPAHESFVRATDRCSAALLIGKLLLSVVSWPGLQRMTGRCYSGTATISAVFSSRLQCYMYMGYGQQGRPILLQYSVLPQCPTHEVYVLTSLFSTLYNYKNFLI